MKLPPAGYVEQVWKVIRLDLWARGFVLRPVKTAKWLGVWLRLQWALWLLNENIRINETLE